MTDDFAAASDAFQGLSDDDKRRMIPKMVAEAARTDPTGVGRDIIGEISGRAEQRAMVRGALGGMDETDRQAAMSPFALPAPTNQASLTTLWILILMLLGLAVFTFGTMTFVLVYQKKSAEGTLALATAALGAIVGLISPSPVRSGGSGSGTD
jgi:hypothetical protein